MRALLTMGAMVGIVAFGHSYNVEEFGMVKGSGMYIALLGVVYFLPTFVAYARRHPGTLMVFVINLFLGWTFIGWVSAIIQACVPIYSSIPISVTDHRNTGGFAG